VALYSYVSTNKKFSTGETDFSFAKGDYLVLLDQRPSGWTLAESRKGQVGLVPGNYLQKLRPEEVPLELLPPPRKISTLQLPQLPPPASSADDEDSPEVLAKKFELEDRKRKLQEKKQMLEDHRNRRLTATQVYDSMPATAAFTVEGNDPASLIKVISDLKMQYAFEVERSTKLEDELNEARAVISRYEQSHGALPW